jgi:hypothetical protein
MGTAKPGELPPRADGAQYTQPCKSPQHNSVDLFVQKATKGGGTGQHHSVTAVEWQAW